MPSKYLNTRDVIDRIPHKKTWLWEAIKKGTFPKPMKIGGRCYWRPEWLDQWDAALDADRQEQAPAA